jgi:hypothetical protein
VKEKLAVLLAQLDAQWCVIDGLFDKLQAQRDRPDPSEADTVLTAYLLHNLYGAIEELFKQVAITFENRVDDLARFHAELLRRMTLDIAGFRPAFLGSEAHRELQELRRFRHVFRHAYDYQLDAHRVSELASQAVALRSPLTQDKDRFRQFLVRSLARPET